MGVHQATVSSKTIQNIGVGNSVEIVVLTCPPLNIPLDNALVLIFWEVVVTLGAAQTSFTPVLRRGSGVSGTQVNVPVAVTTVASTVVKVTGSYFDTPGVVAGQQYTLNLTVNGAASAGTVNDGSITVIAP